MLLPTLAAAVAWCRSPPAPHGARAAISMQHTQGWDGFGKGPFRHFSNFREFMCARLQRDAAAAHSPLRRPRRARRSVFPDEDRQLYPEMFAFPLGVYEVCLQRPLGIQFEEQDGGGVAVTELVDDGNAAIDGVVKPGDVLIAVTAVKVFGARFERKIVPAGDFDFDTVVSAISSNEPRYGARDVVLWVQRPGEADQAQVDRFLEFYQIPFDHVFRTG